MEDTRQTYFYSVYLVLGYRRSAKLIFSSLKLVKNSTAGVLQTLNSIFSSHPASLTSRGRSNLVAIPIPNAPPALA